MVFRRRNIKRTFRRKFTRKRRTFKRNFRRKSSFRRRVPRMNINARSVVLKNVSQDLDLTMVNDGANLFFRTYIRWFANISESLTSPILPLSNAFPAGAFGMGTLPSQDAVALNSLYGDTKLVKIIVKYRPAQTTGVTNTVDTTGVATFAAQDAIMTTLPVYRDVDSITDSAGQMETAPLPSYYSQQKTKPYFREHSIYKPWTRILKPVHFPFYGSYGTSTTPSVQGPSRDWTDMNSSDAPLWNGLQIMMPAIKNGGEFVTATPPTLHPITGASFTLGKLTFTYVQAFKTRR